MASFSSSVMVHSRSGLTTTARAGPMSMLVRSSVISRDTIMRWLSCEPSGCTTAKVNDTLAVRTRNPWL